MQDCARSRFMSTLSLILCPEGNSDGRFLSVLIRRTAQDILNQFANTITEVLPVEVVKVAKQKDGKDILEKKALVELHMLPAT